MQRAAVRPRVQRDPVLVTRPALVAYTSLALILAGYLVSLVARGGPTTPWFDNWFAAALELVAGVLCAIRGLRRQGDRALPLVIAAAILCWAAGDLVLAIESIVGQPASPSMADIFYLSFYPLLYLALIILVRRGGARALLGSWLDGAVAGTGAAALCAAFLFTALDNALQGSRLGVVVSIAYPVGDLLLVLLVVGGSAVLSRSAGVTWRLLAIGCAINAIGDAFNLVNSADYTALGGVIDGIAWPVSLVLMSASVWVRPRSRSLLPGSIPAGMVLPVFGAASGLAVLLTAAVHQVGRVALALGAAAIFIALLRFLLAVRGLRSLTEERHLASLTDELTQLGNRRMLREVLDQYFDEQRDRAAPRRSLSFLFVDLDRFKQVNDSFGHAAGDALLEQLGPRLRDTLRKGDLLVRVGGDEFGIVLIDAAPSQVDATAQRCLAAIRAPFSVEGVAVRVSASIGVATAPEHARDADSLMRVADAAMYRAKVTDAGLSTYRPDRDAASSRLRLAEELRTAIEEGTLSLHFQPQVDDRTGVVVAAEALARWQHPRLGQVPPLHFIPLAEELGLMPAVTSLVLDRALAQCAHWRAEGHDLKVAVNVSASTMLDDDVAARVAEQLQRHALPPSACIIEVTESVIIDDFEACKQAIDRIRAAGMAVSIDDFGAGVTSLAYLGGLIVDEVKLDRSFILGVTGSDRGRDLVRAVIDLGHALRLRVVAEGVEDAATLDLLRDMGCDLVQGYYTGRPAPAEAVTVGRVALTAIAS